jgi:eukaryotic-like serine/threonine-protein kinase
LPLAAGTRLGPYEITDSAGAGGMGEVYKARDTRLDRIVAVKVISDLLAGAPELQERFDREARAISQLNHPNICTLYDVGHHEGLSYLVLEYLDGETLAHRLEKGALPVEQAVAIAIEICDALDKAHRQGIVHRDLKPANVMLTRGSAAGGHAKLLDFGLAKLAAPGGTAGVNPAVSVTAPVTATTPLTTRGAIMGTFQYMAPEQLEGAEADARTDLWAFGCVLHEMLTGRKAFEGKTQATLISAILTAPPSAPGGPAILPRALDHVVQTCLAKHPDERFQSAHDVVLQLRWIARDDEDAAEPLPRKRSRLPGALWTAAAVLVAVAATAVGSWLLWRSDPRPAVDPVRATIDLGVGARLFPLVSSNIALSPDGRRLVHAGMPEEVAGLFVRAVDEFESRPIAGASPGVMPFFSPDGQWIGYFGSGQLMRIPVSGGAATVLCEAFPGGAVWTEGDSIIFTAANNGPLSRISAAGGKAEPLTRLENGETAHRWPALLPGGRAILFAASSGGLWTEARIVVQPLDGGPRQTVIHGGSAPQYVQSGHIVFDRGGALFALPFDPVRLSATGPARPVINNVLGSSNDGRSQFAVSRTGTLVYATGTSAAKRTLVWVTRSGVAQAIDVPPHTYEHPRISPDGRHVALTLRDDDPDVWVLELARRMLTRLTFEPGEDESPIWTPDGKRIAFSASRIGKPRQTIAKAFDGSGAEEILFATPQHQHLGSWSPGGQLVTDEGGANWGIVAGPPQEKQRRVFLNERFSEQGARLSPSGQWLAYTSNESSRTEIYVQGFPGPAGKWQISTEGGIEPQWSRDGRELYYRQADKMLAVTIETQPAFRASAPRLLFEGRYARMGWPQANYDVAADGRFLMIRGDEQALPTTLRAVLNWSEELRRGTAAK